MSGFTRPQMKEPGTQRDTRVPVHAHSANVRTLTGADRRAPALFEHLTPETRARSSPEDAPTR